MSGRLFLDLRRHSWVWNFHVRQWLYVILLLTTVLAGVSWQSQQAQQRYATDWVSSFATETTQRNPLVAKLATLNKKITEAAALAVDVTQAKTDAATVEELIFAKKDYGAATTLLDSTVAAIDSAIAAKTAANAAEAERLAALAKQGTLSGTVKEGSTGLSAVTITVLSGKTSIGSTTSNTSGQYSLAVTEGTYTVTGSKKGYTTYSKSNVAIKAQETTTLDFSMTKAPVTSAATTTTSDSTGASTYNRKTVDTSRGSFTIDQMTFDLGSGKIKVITDTASDDDCTNNCPTKSLASYISANGGFAGINGTYFCPADYASCSGQTGSFYWKIYNSRLQKMINTNNGLGEQDPFMTFSSSGIPTYYSSWKAGSGTSMYAGINSWPALVGGGKVILNESVLDSKQKTTKSNRGALGLKGTTLYAVIAKSATVPDLATIMEAIGMDVAMNIDGGGSSAMYYNGGYKVGAGRGLPNAVIFAHR